MNADELVESYVLDVVRRLPRRQRTDVAFELKSLLHEELGPEPTEAAATPSGRAPSSSPGSA